MDTIKNIKEDIAEVVKERFFSPMYFYFIIAWIITNWKFVYVLLFADSTLILNGQQVSKIDLLFNLYLTNGLIVNALHLFIIPIAFAYLAVWYLTVFSEKFYKKYENYKLNKKVIDREIEYTEKVKFVKIEQEIREIEFDKKNIKYEDNKNFNESLDELNSIVVAGIVMNPSEALYNTDYEGYKESLKEWQDSNFVENLTDKQKWQVIDEYGEELKGEMEVDEMRDREEA